MRATVIGYRRVDMQDERGKPINGHSLFVAFPSNGVEGQESCKLFCSDNLAIDTKFVPKVGGAVNIEFNRYGRLGSISNVG